MKQKDHLTYEDVIGQLEKDGFITLRLCGECFHLLLRHLEKHNICWDQIFVNHLAHDLYVITIYQHSEDNV